MTDFNFCPKCGAQQEALACDYPFICHTCDHTLFLNPASAVAGIIQVGEKVLLTKRGKSPGLHMFDLPGGFVDRDENLESALTREVAEELGIKVNQWHYLCSATNRYHYKDVTYYTCDSVFFCELTSLPDVHVDPKEIHSATWVDIAQIPYESIAFDSLKMALRRYVENKKRGV